MPDKLFYTVAITSILIAIVIIFFVISVIRYHKRYTQLQKERIQAQIMMQEQERKRIANDLHDSLGPMLSTVKLFISSITVNDETDRESIGKASGYIDEAISNLREISYNLLPGSLDRNGLEIVVNEYISRMGDRQPVKINFTVAKGTVIPKKAEIHLFRIIQEIIHNTIKHSGAKNLKLSIATRPDGLLLVSEDNGRGFDPEHTRETSGGLGLKSIDNRCQMLDADFKLISAKNQGCKMIIKVPVNI